MVWYIFNVGMDVSYTHNKYIAYLYLLYYGYQYNSKTINIEWHKFVGTEEECIDYIGKFYDKYADSDNNVIRIMETKGMIKIPTICTFDELETLSYDCGSWDIALRKLLKSMCSMHLLSDYIKAPEFKVIIELLYNRIGKCCYNWLNGDETGEINFCEIYPSVVGGYLPDLRKPVDDMERKNEQIDRILRGN